MAHLIEVTLAGGGYLGPTNDTKTTINADKIIRIDDVSSGQIGTSKITMDDNSEHYVKETQNQLRELTNN